MTLLNKLTTHRDLSSFSSVLFRIFEISKNIGKKNESDSKSGSFFSFRDLIATLWNYESNFIIFYNELVVNTQKGSLKASFSLCSVRCVRDLSPSVSESVDHL